MDLKEVSQSSDVAKNVFSMLGQRERFRRRSDLRGMFYELAGKVKNVNYDDFLTVFENLQEAGVGRIVVGRKNNPDRFLWNYNLKDVAKALPVDKLSPLPKEIRKRKKVGIKAVSSKRKVEKYKEEIAARPAAKASPIQDLSDFLNINIRLSKDTRPADVKALLQLLKEMQEA